VSSESKVVCVCCVCDAAVVFLLLWVTVSADEVVSKISVQLEKSKKDLPAFDVVENLVEEEVGYCAYECCVYHAIFSLEHYAIL